MSERQAAGGPAGRCGDGPGVEGSQAAASGTQAGGRRVGPPGLGAPLVARGSAAPCAALPRAPWRRGPARASPSRAEPPPSLPRGRTPAPAAPARPGTALELARYSCFETLWFPPRFLSPFGADGGERAALPPAPPELQLARGSLLGSGPQTRRPRCPLLVAPHPAAHLCPGPAFPRALCRRGTLARRWPAPRLAPAPQHPAHRPPRLAAAASRSLG